VNPSKLTILTADTDAACDPETGTCTIPQTPTPSPGAAPVTGAVLPGMEGGAGSLTPLRDAQVSPYGRGVG
jgi:hypothetical protein